MKLSLRCALLLLALAAAPSVSSAEIPASALSDSGTFTIYVRERTLGHESFALVAYGDSLVLTSNTVELIPNPDGVDSLQKQSALVLKGEDYDLRSYESHQSFQGQRLHRGLQMSDTSFIAFTQVNEHGQGDELVRPPGRIFVLDPQVFSLYDILCRNLHGRTFDERPIQFFQLGAPDTSFEATATDLGAETIRWGGRPVQARKIQIHYGAILYYLWISPRGRMLRLAQPAYALRVERLAAAVKRPAPRPRPGG